MNQQPIGVFDSGLGGLTVLRELQQLLPNETFIYFGDTARVPYGSRSPETILKYVQSDIRFLNRFDVKLIVAACGTASAVALPQLQDVSTVPLISVVEPAAKEAAEITSRGPVGVLGTQGTIRSGAFQAAIQKENPALPVLARACPLFVPLVENGYIQPQNPITQMITEEYLKELREAEVETVIMGCTHYPLLESFLRAALPQEVKLVNMGRSTAAYVRAFLLENGLERTMPIPPQSRYFWSEDTKNPEMFRRDAVLYEYLNQMEKIEIDGV